MFAQSLESQKNPDRRNDCRKRSTQIESPESAHRAEQAWFAQSLTILKRGIGDLTIVPVHLRGRRQQRPFRHRKADEDLKTQRDARHAGLGRNQNEMADAIAHAPSERQGDAGASRNATNREFFNGLFPQRALEPHRDFLNVCGRVSGGASQRLQVWRHNKVGGLEAIDLPAR